MTNNLEEVVLTALAEHPAAPVRLLVTTLRESGYDVIKPDVNATLYRALAQGKVVREGDSPPHWSLAGSKSSHHATDPEWIMDRWLERTGDEWSAVQRRAAAAGTRVLSLVEFTEAELGAALCALSEETLTWSAWRAAAVAERSRSIKI
jgi:hypothetical protein